MTAVTELADQASRLRNQMVDALVADGKITSPAVEAAFRIVERHTFAPEADLETVYKVEDAVRTKFAADGTCTSSVSAPWLQALMLEQADLHPGDGFLEIGSGGCAAALGKQVVGESGSATTMDIDPEITARASRFLRQAGYGDVTVVTGDGERGWPDSAPYAAVIVTAQACDIPPAWTEQLAPGGRLVVPLSICGQNRTYTFIADGDHLRATDAIFSGFVPMQGIGGRDARRRTVELGGTQLALSFLHTACDDPEALSRALDYPAAVAWSGTQTGEGFYLGGLQMYLATVLPGACQGADADHLVPDGVRRFPPTWAAAGNFGYLATKKVDGRFALGSVAFGPTAAQHSERLAALITRWYHEVRDGPGMTVTAHPRDTADADLPDGRVIDTVHRRIVIAFPPNGSDQASTAIQP